MYDLRVSPASYDLAVFLRSAEEARRAKGCSFMNLILVRNARNGGYREDGFRGELQNNIFFYNVMIQMTALFPSVKDVHIVSPIDKIIDNVEPDLVYPPDWTFDKPTAGHLQDRLVLSHPLIRSGFAPEDGITAPEYAVDYVKSVLRHYIGNRKIVTITARELDRDDPAGKRSLNLPAWRDYAEWAFKSEAYIPIFVRDTHTALGNGRLSHFREFPEFSLNLHYRSALYQLSHINFFKVNGPLTLSMYNYRCKTIVFFTPDSHSSTSLDWYEKKQNMLPGDQFPCTNRSCLLVWADDNLSNIRAAQAELESRDKARSLNLINNTPEGWSQRACFVQAQGRFGNPPLG